jgi:flavodoxin
LHHQNTAKIANVFSRVFSTPVRSPSEVTVDELVNYDMVGFGSGIYSQKHHHSILDFVEQIPNEIPKSAFIFSTSGISRKFAVKNSLDDPHTEIRQMLQKKKWSITGDFNCTGWNTNSFLKFFGGMNKGKPDSNDLDDAEKFARGLLA